MSSYMHKHILVAGDKTANVTRLIEKLETHGFQITSLECDEITLDLLNKEKIQLIIFNHINDNKICDNLLEAVRNKKTSKVTPVFSMVENTSHDIQEALTHGVTDFISANEDTDSVIQKIESALNESNAFAGGSTIDITPTEADVTSTGIKVFIIEDDPLLRNLLSIRMEKSSFPYEFSSDGKGIIPALHQFKPDAIILDLMLPGKSGFEVLAEIKADPKLKPVPLIVFSNRDGSDERAKAKELGAVSFHVKAMTDLSELVEQIETITNNRK